MSQVTLHQCTMNIWFSSFFAVADDAAGSSCSVLWGSISETETDIKNEQKCLDLLTFVLELRERLFEQHIPTRSESDAQYDV